MAEQLASPQVNVVGSTKRIRAVVAVDLLINVVLTVLTPFGWLGREPEPFLWTYVILFGIIIRLIMIFGLIPLWLSTSPSRPLQSRIACAKTWATMCLIYLILGTIGFVFMFVMGYHWILLLDTLIFLPFRFVFLRMARSHSDQLCQAKINSEVEFSQP